MTLSSKIFRVTSTSYRTHFSTYTLPRLTNRTLFTSSAMSNKAQTDQLGPLPIISHEKIPTLERKLVDMTSNLVYISEGEHSFEPFCIPKEMLKTPLSLPSEEEFFKIVEPFMQQNSDISVKEDIEKSSLEFNHFVTQFQKNSQGTPQVQSINSFSSEMKQLFGDNVRVYRFGKIRIHVFITGLLDEVGLIGVKTVSIET